MLRGKFQEFAVAELEMRPDESSETDHIVRAILSGFALVAQTIAEWPPSPPVPPVAPEQSK